MDRQDQLEKEGLPDHWVLPDSQDPRVHLDPQEKMVCPDTLEHVVTLDSKEKLVHLDQLVWLDHKVLMERLVLLV